MACYWLLGALVGRCTTYLRLITSNNNWYPDLATVGTYIHTVRLHVLFKSIFCDFTFRIGVSLPLLHIEANDTADMTFHIVRNCFCLCVSLNIDHIYFFPSNKILYGSGMYRFFSSCATFFSAISNFYNIYNVPFEIHERHVYASGKVHWNSTGNCFILYPLLSLLLSLSYLCLASFFLPFAFPILLLKRFHHSY